MSSDDADRTRHDPKPPVDDLVSQATPRPAPEVEPVEDPNATRPTGASPAPDSSAPVEEVGEATGKSDTAEPVDEKTVVSGPQVSGADVDTDNFIPSEFGPAAKLDSQETTRFGPNIAAKQAVREFRKAKRDTWKEIGRFEIIRELGAGAFGKVLLAQDRQLDRPVAIKVAKAGAFHSEEDKQRFLREARAAANLRHPHIVPVYEFGEHDGTNYIAYEFIEGRTLRQMLRDEPKLKALEAADLLIKIASALDYAHENRIVHRDVKPENILIDEAGQPHMADFGCARQDDTNVLLTLEGAVMGTPAYMSPEQASGASHKADRRADVWSLGVIMNELLTGERPFKGNITEILLSIRSTEPRPIRQFDSSLPKDLETIVQKCMAKEPKERFQTAGELVDELERWKRGEPIISRPINVFARTWRWAKRNPQVAGLVSAVVLTFALGAAASSAALYFARLQQKRTVLESVDKLDTAESQEFPLIVSRFDTDTNRRAVVAKLRERWQDDQASARSHGRYGAALVAMEPKQFVDTVLPELRAHTLSDVKTPAEFRALLSVLADQSSDFLGADEAIWRDTDVATPSDKRIRAFAALAAYDSESPNWPVHCDELVELLLNRDEWIDALMPVRDSLRVGLAQRFATGAYEGAVASTIGKLFSDDPEWLVELTGSATSAQLRGLLAPMDQTALVHIGRALNEPVTQVTSPKTAEFGDEAHRLATRRANLLLAQLKIADDMGETPRELWLELGNDAQPDVRTEFIERVRVTGIDANSLVKMIDALGEQSRPDQASQLMALLLGLGEYRLVDAEVARFKASVVAAYQNNPDPGVHSAADWLLRSWEVKDVVATGDIDGSHWRDLSDGPTMVAIGPVSRFTMGSSPAEIVRFHVASETEDETQHDRAIRRRFEISTREVTVGEYAKFISSLQTTLESALDEANGNPELEEDLTAAIDGCRVERAQLSERRPEFPMTEVSWASAVMYCRWVSDQQGVPEASQCYAPLTALATRRLADPAVYADGVSEDSITDRKGFRLPTIGEWEYACRGKALTAWPQGDSPVHLDEYAWVARPNLSDPLVPASLKPNRFGLFDMLGNASEWCHCVLLHYPQGGLTEDPYWNADAAEIREAREIRGGHYFDLSEKARPAARREDEIDDPHPWRGFRIARTIEVVDLKTAASE